MNSTTKTVLSPVLAGNLSESGACGRIELQESKAWMSKIKTIPTFHAKEEDFPSLNSSVLQCFAAMGERSRRRTLARADSYGIPHSDFEDIDWRKLHDKIDEHEELLREAKELCLEWEEDNYDPIALRSRIDARYDEAQKDLHSYFYATRGV